MEMPTADASLILHRPTQAPVLDALHQRASELGGSFRAMNTTGKMGRIKAAKTTGPTTAAGGADRKEAPPHGRTASR
jgi:hypothetical protein